MKIKRQSNCIQSARLSIGQPPIHLNTNKWHNCQNKENFIQITEPLEPSINLLSKEFILSKDSLNRKSKLALKDSSNITQAPIRTMQTSKQFLKGAKQTKAFDRRLSLKCVGNVSNNEASQRMSMLPIRRDSIGTTFTISSVNYPEERQSMGNGTSLQRESLRSIRPNDKKQTIITNLMNKLDHQEDLRSIIESKLKDRNQSHMTDASEEYSSMANQLKQSQNQVKYFKALVKEMSQKINILSKVSHLEADRFSLQKSTTSKTYFENNKPDMLCTCAANFNSLVSKTIKQAKSIGIQTQFIKDKQKQIIGQEPSVFMENLQKTLKMLEVKRKSTDQLE